MSAFWNFKFNDTEDFIETFDELPLWSAPFGLLLLKHIELKPSQTVIDIGSGAGFPLFEVAERLGPSSKCYGIDPWVHAVNRARKKLKNYEAANVEIIEASADNLPFTSKTVDLIISNLGINNFNQPDKVFGECHRVLKPGGKLALTTNLNGHWKEFYTVFEETCRQNYMPEAVLKLKEQQEHRGTVATISALFTNSGFKISRVFEEKFEMRFLNGTAFLNHHFVKVGWLSSWLEVVPQSNWPVFFPQLEKNLNNYALKLGGLTLTVPMAFLEGEAL